MKRRNLIVFGLLALLAGAFGVITPVIGQMAGVYTNQVTNNPSGTAAVGILNIDGGQGVTNGISLGSAATATPIKGLRVFTAAQTPGASSAAIQTAGQTFTFTGITTADLVFLGTGPAPTSLCPPVQVKATAADTVTIYFSTLTAAGCTPAAGSYSIVAIRQ